MADEIDAGSAHEEELRLDALREWQRRRGPVLSAQESAAECADCGEEIPEARRQAAPGCTRCVDCQAEAERLGR